MLFSILIFLLCFFFLRPQRQLNCGLFGLASNFLSEYELDFLKPMSHLSSLRGVDSSGLCAITKTGKKRPYASHVIRALQMPAPFIYEKGVNNFLGEHKNKVAIVMVHNRHATLGAVNKDNIHPFRAGPLVGMHNGTVSGIIPKGSSQTDSQTIYEMMAAEGLEATIDKIRHGAFTLVWADTEKQTLNFIRNSQRPLYFMKRYGTLMWMSEKWMLEILKDKTNANGATIEELPIMTHVSVKFGQVELIKRGTYFAAAKPQEVPFLPALPSPQSTQTSVPVVVPKTVEISTSALPGYPYTEVTTLTNAPRSFIGPGGKTISLLTYHKLTKCGCINCEKKVPMNQTIHWAVDPGNNGPVFFCDDCHKLGLYKVWNLDPRSFIKGGPKYDA